MIGHFQVTHRSRLGGASRRKTTLPNSAVAHLHYITRTGEYGPESGQSVQQFGYVTRMAESTHGREDLVHIEHVNYPAFAQDNPLTFWQAAETWSRANARLSTTWEFALPRELTVDQQIAAVRDFYQVTLGEKQHPATIAMHETKTVDGTGTNPHVHMIFSWHHSDGIERDARTYFRRVNHEHPEHGGAPRADWLKERSSLYAVRQAWADTANLHLERAGALERVYAGRLKDIGIDREPERHSRGYDSAKVKYQGKDVAGWREIADARQAHAADRPHEQALHAAAWTDRKQQLGITPDLSHTAALERVAFTCQDTVAQQQQLRQHVPVQRMTREQLQARMDTLTQELQQLDQLSTRVHLAWMKESVRDRTGTRRREAETRELVALGIDLSDEAPQPGAQYRSRDRGKGRDRGRESGWSW